MSLIDERQDFSDIADVFLRHGSMQSPAFLDGRLCGLLALRDVTAEWRERDNLESLASRDGLTLPSYLTLPPGSDSDGASITEEDLFG